MIAPDSWKLVTTNSFNTKYRDLDISIIQNNNSTYTLNTTFQLGSVSFINEISGLASLDAAKLNAEIIVTNAYKDAPPVPPVNPVRPPINTPPRPSRTL